MRVTVLMMMSLGVAAAAPMSARAAAFYQSGEGEGILQDSLEARVWLDRGDEPVVEPGDDVRVYYRTTEDAFAAIFRIDTDGRISMLFPHHPGADSFVPGGRDYRLLLSKSPRWRVRDDPGVGYFFMLASPFPLDFSGFDYDVESGWDLSGVGEVIYEDPYVAIDDYVAALLPSWDTEPYALDFLSYSVGEEHEYPRFLCYDCHDFQNYASWNPYADLCTSYQVVVWNDPYFVPRYRYSGTRVVFARPYGPRPRYGVTLLRPGGPRGPIVRTRPAPPRRIGVYKESPRRPSRPSARRGVSPRSAAGAAGRSSVRPPINRVPPRAGAASTPSRSSRATSARTAPARPTLQRRAPSQRGASTRVAPPRSTSRPDARSAPVRSARPGAARPAPTRSSGPRARPTPIRTGGPRARPTPIRTGGPRARPAPTRSGESRARPAPARSGGSRARPAPARSGGPRVQPAPSRSGRPEARPTPTRSGGPARGTGRRGRPSSGRRGG
jgi:hypothetical protein